MTKYEKRIRKSLKVSTMCASPDKMSLKQPKVECKVRLLKLRTLQTKLDEERENELVIIEFGRDARDAVGGLDPRFAASPTD